VADVGRSVILGFVVRIFCGIEEGQWIWELDMLTYRNPDLGFTTCDSIHGNPNQYQNK